MGWTKKLKWIFFISFKFCTFSQNYKMFWTAVWPLVAYDVIFDSKLTNTYQIRFEMLCIEIDFKKK